MLKGSEVLVVEADGYCRDGISGESICHRVAFARDVVKGTVEFGDG